MSYKVMVVDDEAIVRQSVASQIPWEKYQMELVHASENAVDALRSGVNSVHILDGRVEHSLLLELFTDAGCGTMIKDTLPSYG